MATHSRPDEPMLQLGSRVFRDKPERSQASTENFSPFLSFSEVGNQNGTSDLVSGK
jgi:hypothetical protein